ncbi:glycoside hydrolase family 9 protein [Gilvimarinus polysaccharolyticus]|uniref:glycoside hydrolase family 9 protein n=1 Tax=Gilvimarinus polysaccharolyticus TaxID=863921 RepID=UPI0006735A03|nr:glycoside hydrolase family 9 protein [Gilvimarinus polysaccharolyticus]
MLALVLACGAGSLAAQSALAEANLFENSSFDGNYFPWVVSSDWGEADFSATVVNDQLCLNVTDSGTFEWGITLRQDGIKLTAGTEYSYSFDVKASNASSVKFQVTHELDGWIGIHTPTASAVSTSWTTLQGLFTPSSDYEGVYAGFQMGGGLVPDNTEICFDNIELICPDCEDVTDESSFTPVHVNQAGYLTALDKIATYAVPSDASVKTAPRSWRLLQGTRAQVEAGSATEVATGVSASVGSDSASGDYLHSIDFSNVTATGAEFVLEVSEGIEIIYSPTFAINDDVYSQLKYDALAYFYHNRAGMAIDAALVGNDLARDAGHVYDNNLSTKGCVDASFECRNNLDVGGGWYDAGDHGKYVVNGGISVWTMLNQYERAMHLGANAADFSDGTMAIPEAGNGIADILDEARYEIEWILKMQIPQGADKAGMVYHKLHDDAWTGNAFNPADATSTGNPRHVWAPSTAATLNFAAIGAQCYRVYRTIDPDFAAECLTKAQLAYQAAKNNAYQRSPLTHSSNDGGGQYEDLPGDRLAEGASYVQDEFYWAATELYIAANLSGTLNPVGFASDMQAASAYHLLMPATDPQTSMTWAHVSGLGVLSLATVGDDVPVDASWVAQARQAVIDRADVYVTATQAEGYGVPFNVNTVYWGSNSNVLNNTLLMGLARDFSGCTDGSYVEAMNRSMGYILGRNPMGVSYVTGFGETAVENPHHRYWAHSVNSNYPTPPAGVLVGGPNAGMEDPVAQALLAGCDPLKCYVDELQAFSTNEITINWNTPLAWAAAYMDEVAKGDIPQACGGVTALPGVLPLGASSTGQINLAVLNGDNNSLTYEIVDQPQHGVLGTAGIGSGIVTYSMTGSGSSDSFSYRIFDINSGVWSEPALVSISRDTVGAACSFDTTLLPHQYSNQWQGEIAIENTSASATSEWEVILEFPAGTTMSSAWGPQMESLGANRYRVFSSAWNAVIPAGQAYVFGVAGDGSNGLMEEPVLSGETCGEPVNKTLLLYDTIDNGVFYYTLPVASFFNATGVPDENIIAYIDGEAYDLTGIFCCRGNFFMWQQGLSLGDHTISITTGSGLAQEEDSATFTHSNAMASCSIDSVEEWGGNGWEATIAIENRGFVPGSYSGYYWDWAAPNAEVLAGDHWSVKLEWLTNDYSTDASSKAILVPDGSANVEEQLYTNGFNANRYMYFLTAADRTGEIAGHGVQYVTLQGQGSFVQADGSNPYIGCSFGNYDQYDQ